MRVFVGDQREVITKYSTFIFGGVVEVAASTNLCVCAVLLLQEQVRGLRVQELKLVVGVAAPSDLAGAILVEIFIVLKAGMYSKCARTSKQFFRVCDCSSLSLICVYIYCILILFILYILNIFVLN